MRYGESSAATASSKWLLSLKGKRSRATQQHPSQKPKQIPSPYQQHSRSIPPALPIHLRLRLRQRMREAIRSPVLPYHTRTRNYTQPNVSSKPLTPRVDDDIPLPCCLPTFNPALIPYPLTLGRLTLLPLIGPKGWRCEGVWFCELLSIRLLLR